MAIPQGFIDELLSRVDLVEVIGRYVPLKRTGANFSGLCPFHSEKSPSFTVSPSKQFFHCFGCGKNGNAIGFLMEHTGSGFVETVQDLAQQCGLTVPQEQLSPQEMARQQAQREQRKTLTEVLEQAAQAYRERLKTTPLAIDYLKKRGLSGEIARRFGLGYAPDTWHGLASVFAAYDDPLLEQSGLVIHNAQEDRRYDRFRGRVMFPIRNERGECIAFGGRVIWEEIRFLI
jgi:DNA primase